MSLYGTKISISEKYVSDIFFHSQNMFHNISYWLKPKNQQKIFRPHFSKIITSYCPPMGPKIQFPKNTFPTFFHSQNMFQNISYWLKPKSHQQFFRQLFSLTKHVSQHFILIKAKKIIIKFLDPIFQKWLQVIIPLWNQNFDFRKKRFRHFFTHKTCFTTFHID